MTLARFVTVVLWLGAAFFLFAGAWAFFAPHSFYDELATFPPYNRHFIHDIGAFQAGIGAVLLLALWRNDAPLAALAGAGAGALLHFVSHIVDNDRGGRDSDVAVFAAVAALLLAAAAARWRLTAP